MKYTILSCLMLFSVHAFAQKSITGTVVDAEGLALPGVTVQVEGSNVGTTTSINGTFQIRASEGDVIVVSFVGMNTQRVTVGSQSEYNIKLLSDQELLDQVVVVGYGTQKKENLTGSVSTVNVARTLESKPVADISKSIQGNVPGLTITYGNGGINASPTFKLRGYGSVNGNSNPLVLVDGVESDLAYVNSEDIKTFSVLKDAASTAIYGARAAYGVVLITTKSGRKSDKINISYSNNFSWNTPIFDLKHAPVDKLFPYIDFAKKRSGSNLEFFGMGGDEWLSKIYEWDEQYGGQDLGLEMVQGRDFDIVENGTQLRSYRNWDVFDLILADWSTTQTHTVKIDGGTEKFTYYASYGYTDQEGYYEVNRETLEKHNIALNTSAKLTQWLNFNTRVQYAKRTYEEPYNYRGGTLGYLFYAMRWPSVFPYGTYEGNSFNSVMAYLRGARRNQTTTNYSRYTGEMVAQLLPELKFNIDYTYSTTGQVEHIKGGEVPMWNWWSDFQFESVYRGSSHDRAAYNTTTRQRNAMNAYLNYTKKFGDHAVTVLVGSNQESYGSLEIESQGNILLSLLYPEPSLTGGTYNVDNSRYDWAVRGYFSRINYNYKGKYLLELNGRIDGSSRFPAAQRYAFFPSTSVGYNISEEPFMNNLKPILSSLKLRLSYGQIGNQDIGQYRFVSTLSKIESEWLLQPQPEQTFQNPTLVSTDLTWETISTVNIGIDFGFWKDRLTGSLDIFQRTTTDMLAPGKTLPSVLGETEPLENSGAMQTRGWELTLNFNHNFNKDLGIYATFVLSDAQSKITKWSNETGTLTDFYEGKVLGEIWGFETDRLFNSSDVNADGQLKDEIPSQSGLETAQKFTFGVGDVKYKDLDGDKSITRGAYTVTDHGDLRVIGNSLPRFEYSLRVGVNYKNFDISAFFQGIGKRDYWATGNTALAGYHYDNLFEHQTDYWTEDNPNAFYPKPYVTNQGNFLSNTRDIGQLSVNGYTTLRGLHNYIPQTRFLQDLSYLRFKELTIGYTLPSKWSKKVKISKARLYATAFNLAEITNTIAPIDPELSTNGSSSYVFFGATIPNSRSFSFGLQVNF